MKKIITILSCFFGILSASKVSAQEFINTKVDILEGSGQILINQVVYKPASFSTSKTYPLVVFLHGMGEAGTNIQSLYNTGLPKVLKDGYKPPFDFIMIAPQRGSYSVDPATLNQILNEAIIDYPNIDKSRIYLTGLSAGGWGCYGSQLNVNTTLGKRFAGIVVMSGATQDANKANMSWWATTRTPLWAVVGASDLSYAEQNSDMVSKINAQVANLASITLRAGYAHDGWNDVYLGNVTHSSGKNMWNYLYQFTRDASGNIATGASYTG